MRGTFESEDGNSLHVRIPNLTSLERSFFRIRAGLLWALRRSYNAMKISEKMHVQNTGPSAVPMASISWKCPRYQPDLAQSAFQW